MTRLVPAFISILALSRLAHADEPATPSEPAAPEHEHEHEHGPWEMRVSVESPLYRHASDGSENIGDATEVEPDIMISYVLEEKHMSFDLEVGEEFLLRASDAAIDTPQRIGTIVRPGIAYSPSRSLPIFVTGLLPFHIEPSPVLLELRLGAGIDAHTPIGKWFVEADVDFSLVGGTGTPGAFAEQSLVLATGLLFHLPG